MRNADTTCAISSHSCCSLHLVLAAPCGMRRFYSCTAQRPGAVPATCTGGVRFFAWNHPPAEPRTFQQQQQGQPAPTQQEQGPSQSNTPAAPPHEAAAAATAAVAAAAGSADTATEQHPGTCSTGNSSDNSSEALMVLVPVPYNLPPTRYAHDGSDRPWCWDEHFPGVDRFGSRCQNLARQLHK
jgi:hypothetical protein